MNILSLVFVLIAAHGAPSKPASSMTMTEAQQFFEEFKLDKSLPFHLPEAGCEKRSYIMKYRMDQKGFESSSFVIVGNRSYQFVLDNIYGPAGVVSWNFHTVPIVKVKIKSGSKQYVIDPSLFDKPVSLEKMLQTLDPNGKCLEVSLSNLASKYKSDDVYGADFGKSSCYWFMASKYFYSPMQEDLSIHEQFKYNSWQWLSEAQSILNCSKEQEARELVVKSGKTPSPEIEYCVVD
jgi:hypothetical protein